MEKEVKKMKKVAYLVSKVNKDEKFKGVGYLFGDDLLIAATSSKGNLYIKTIPTQIHIKTYRKTRYRRL